MTQVDRCIQSLTPLARADDPQNVELMQWYVESVSEAECVLCHDLDPGQRAAMRADLLEIPSRETVCDQWTRSPPIFSTLEEGGEVITALGGANRGNQ
jgi:hypothetical protein